MLTTCGTQDYWNRRGALSNLPVPHDTVEAGDFESDCFCPPPRRAGDLRAGGARPPWACSASGFGSRGAWSPGRCGLAAAASGRREADFGVGA